MRGMGGVPLKNKVMPVLTLIMVCMVVAGALGLVNDLTADRIRQQALDKAAAARREIFSEADAFEEVDTGADSGIDNCYAAMQGDELLGYVAQVTVTGFGGPIEVQTGICPDGTVKAISVGGAGFSETSGLGAKTRDHAFRDQFQGISIPAQLKGNVDSVTGASVSSGAVCSAVNKAGYFVRDLMSPPVEDDRPEDLQFGGVLPGATTKEQQTAPEGADELYTSDAGCVVYVTGDGRNGDMQVQVGVAHSGQVAGVYIDPAKHKETEGLGDAVEERYFWSQFVGHTGPFAAGDNIDAVSGATISSNAVIDCVNRAVAIAAPYLDPSLAVDIGTMDGGAAGESAAARIGYPEHVAQVVKTRSGVTVMTAEEWAETYPEIYASYMANADNDEVVEYTEEYPMIPVLYEGMGFAQYYGSARGHAYTIEDVTSTGRPHALANCFTCKTPDYTNMVNEQGVSAYQMPFEDALASINEPISCYNCHANTGDELVITHTYLADALGEELPTVDAATLSCGQCHVEYYFHPADKSTSLPYTSLDTMTPDNILDYYNSTTVDGEVFADYVNPRTGVRQIKVQHPEFETFMGETSVHAHGLDGAEKFTCADCHMGEAVSEDGVTYVSHTWTSPLDNQDLIDNTCSACHTDLAGEVEAIQTETERRTYAIGYELELLTDKLAAAVESGDYTDQELEDIRALARSAQFYWDFVFVENSEGAHNSALARECLDKSEAILNEAMALLH